MKRVLVITYYWPPTGGSGVQRWVKFAKYLPDLGWEPVIYTPENPEMTAVDRTLEKEISPDLEVIKRPIMEPYNLYRKLMGKGAETDLKKLAVGASGPGAKEAAGSRDEVTPISSGKKSWKQRLSLWIRANVFVPDPRVTWVKPSVRFLKKYLKEHPVDAIVTTGPPQSMHLIGQKLHEALGIPWVPDFRDPWTRMYYLKHLPLTKSSWNKLLKMEQGVLDSCTTVLTCTPMVQDDYAARTKTPVEMITNGFDINDFEIPRQARNDNSAGLEMTADSGQNCSDDRSRTKVFDDVLARKLLVREGRNNFVVTHTGLLAADGNPENLWRALQNLAEKDPEFREKLQINLIGRVDKAVLDTIGKAGLTPNTLLPGYLDHAATNEAQHGADVLVLPLRNDPDYAIILPGKLFEYLASRRPILGIGQKDGAMAQILDETKSGITAEFDDIDTMQAFLEDAWKQFKSGGIPPTGGDIDKYSRQSTARQLAGLLDKIS
ncbi:MAG: hypothetical protein K6A64_03830 [Bacteroidales bacterium]|nr:hypothetical protein [Bacteroidales bacterium]